MSATPPAGRPGIGRAARLAPLALLCALLLSGCISTTARTGPAPEPAPASPAAAAHPSPPLPSPREAPDPQPVERLGVAGSDPDAKPAKSGHDAQQGHRGAHHPARVHTAPRHRAHAHHPAHHPGNRRGGSGIGLCDLGTRFGRWAPGSAAERSCRGLYG
ncbi:hypothetical protein ACIQGZ_05990 [Streptomyces sp. NPDC092296]|uniref:hypothetical protein n=1 Tax=Streptomyces sp. NPDC092296 TaxID=3366012 RepID=UPI00382A0B07